MTSLLMVVEGTTAASKVIDALLWSVDLLTLKRVVRAAGRQAVEFKDGSVILIRSNRSSDSFRGLSVDCVIDTTDTAEEATAPCLAASGGKYVPMDLNLYLNAIKDGF